MSETPHDGAEPAPALSPFQQQLCIYIRASYPILYLVTAEEDRGIELVAAALRQGGLAERRPYVWSVSRGLCAVDGKVVDAKVQDPKRLLPALVDWKDPGVFLLEDFHGFLDERSPLAALVTRQLRDVVQPFRATRKTIVLISPVLKLPPELEKDVTVMDLELPGEPELAAVLDDTVEQVSGNSRVDVRLAAGGVSGAELEQAVVSALYAAFAESEKAQLADRHLEAAIAETVPLSASMAPRIAALRKDAGKRWRLALPPADESGAFDAAAVEAPPALPKRRRVFEV